MNVEIRESRPEDSAAIMALYPKAFPDEELRPVVRALLDGDATVISLVGVVEDAIVGHVIFTLCGIDDSENTAALLGPLGVDPALQKRGVGSALVQHGFRLLEMKGVAHVYVLGDPAYYKRFGFAPEADIAPPYPMPPEWREAWQSFPLARESATPRGTLTVPAPWRDPALWGP